jgi:hypothetical protein
MLMLEEETRLRKFCIASFNVINSAKILRFFTTKTQGHQDSLIIFKYGTFVSGVLVLKSYSDFCGFPQALQNAADDEITAPQLRHCN